MLHISCDHMQKLSSTVVIMTILWSKVFLWLVYLYRILVFYLYLWDYWYLVNYIILKLFLHFQFGKSLDNMYTNSRFFRSVACLMSPGVKSASSTTPAGQSSTSPAHSPQHQLHLQISLRFLASYKTLIYLFVFWLFCEVKSMNTVLVILLWILVLGAMVLCHLTPRHEKSLINRR